MHDIKEVGKRTIDALSLPTAAERRSALRRLVSEYSADHATEIVEEVNDNIDPTSSYHGERFTIGSLIQALPWQSLAAILVPNLHPSSDLTGMGWPLEPGTAWCPVLRAIKNLAFAANKPNGQKVFGSTINTYDLSPEKAIGIIQATLATTTTSTKTEENDTMAFDLNTADLGDLLDGLMVFINKTGSFSMDDSGLTELIAELKSERLLEGERAEAATALVQAMKLADNLKFDEVSPSTTGTKVAERVTASMGGSSTTSAPASTTLALDPTKIPINPGLKPALDAIFGQAVGGMKFDDFMNSVGQLKTIVDGVGPQLERAKELEEQVEKLSKALAQAPAAAAPKHYASSGAIPNCKVERVNATTIFTEAAKTNAGKKLLNFEVPVFVWDGDNPFVPAIDENYEFDIGHLVAVLMSIVYGKPLWAAGPTGSGKSSLIMQVAARLGYMLRRVNFDAEMTRLDFIGRDTLVTDGSGKTVSKYIDGILPDTMGKPMLLLLDEIDFIRPDVAAVLMPVAEMDGTPLVITEDGGRIVQPDPMFRIFATSNTKGTGDDTRVYQGTRPQSMALRNRFTGGFIEVDYLKEPQEVKMVMSKVPGLHKTLAEQLVRCANEIRRAFVQGDIMETCSPRDLFAVAQSYLRFNALTGDHKVSLKSALELNLLNRASAAEKQSINELIQRIIA